MENVGRRKRALTAGGEEESHLTEHKRLRSDILQMFEDDGEELLDKNSESESPSEEMLHTVMRSLQEEIDVDLSLSGFSDAIETPDLGYLLGASDDDLGLPPAGSEEAVSDQADAAAGIRSSELPDLTGCWEFDDDLMNVYAMADFVGFIPGLEDRRGEEEDPENVPVFDDGLFSFIDELFSADGSSLSFLRPDSSLPTSL